MGLLEPVCSTCVPSPGGEMSSRDHSEKVKKIAAFSLNQQYGDNTIKKKHCGQH